MHVAKYLSQKEQRRNIGDVHIRYELDGESRKISLILTPPIGTETNTSTNIKNRQKSRTTNGKAKNSTPNKSTKSKVRFRLRLVFGVEFQRSSEGIDTNAGWIPSSRLFPNRCNNKFMGLDKKQKNVTDKGTP